MRITNSPKNKKHKGLKVIAVILILIAALFLDSNFRIVCTKYELFYDNLPQSFDGYRVVQISDLHMSEYGEHNKNLIKSVKKQEPDIIVLTGDVLNNLWEKKDMTQTEELRPFLEELSKIAPCYFVSGNHEWASGEIRLFMELLQEINIVYLHNEFVLLKKDGESIVLAGVEDPNGPADMTKPDSLANGITQKYPEKYTLLLAHRNDWLKKYPDLPVDTILSGHAHGGIMRLPFVGGVFGTEQDFFPKYDSGLYNEGNYDMVLSRGLGGKTLVPRLLNNPELVTVILRKS